MQRRPFPGEPLPLDLLNTQWRHEGESLDQLDSPDGARSFAADHGVTVSRADGARAQRNLRAARDVVRALAEHRATPAVIREGHRIVGHGRPGLAAGPGGSVTAVVEGDDPSWTVAVRAVLDVVDLLATAPDRVRACAHPDCVLWFLDTSRSGARRWCSMATCGNRSKAARHYERHRDD